MTDPPFTQETRPVSPSPRRVREVGLTGGETPERDRVTADDAAPQTLIDEGGGTDPAEPLPRAADAEMTIVDASAAGLGGGTDEAEDAIDDPVSPQELRRIRARVARSGGALTNVEPNESSAGSPGRERAPPK